MKPKTTAIWFALAVILAATIWFTDRYRQSSVPVEIHLLAGLRADQVTGIQIIPAGAREISVVRSNKIWQLEKPIVYPAQATAIASLLGALEKLTPVISISAAEMSGRKNADAEFGFENPQFTLDLTAGEQTWHLRVGNKTAPGDGVYVRVVGAAGAFVTDPAWLQFLPRNVTSWRDTTLVDVNGLMDWLVITNGAKAIELRRDQTNHLWRMTRPIQARADNLRIVTALQQLRTATVSQFVTDDPKADLTTYGLAPAGLDVWLGYGTNYLAAIHAGKDVPGNPAQMFARREGWNAVVTTAKEPLAPWRGTVNDFRDPHLLELTAPVAEIEVRGQNNFTLQCASNGWTVAGEKFPVDAESVRKFVQLLAGFRVADFVQDVVTGPGLALYGLTNPVRQITLRSAVGDTNSTIAQLIFGAANTNGQIYVKRADENSVYALTLADWKQLPESGWEFRDLRIWNFSETNVAQVTLKQNGKTRVIVRSGVNQWSLAPGSQGVLENLPAIEETVHRLGQLTAYAWFRRNFPTPAQDGFNTNNLEIVVELKSGEKFTLDFGAESAQAGTAVAAVTRDGDRWEFVLNPTLYQMIAAYLKLPPNAP